VVFFDKNDGFSFNGGIFVEMVAVLFEKMVEFVCKYGGVFL